MIHRRLQGPLRATGSSCSVSSSDSRSDVESMSSFGTSWLVFSGERPQLQRLMCKYHIDSLIKPAPTLAYLVKPTWFSWLMAHSEARLCDTYLLTSYVLFRFDCVQEQAVVLERYVRHNVQDDPKDCHAASWTHIHVPWGHLWPRSSYRIRNWQVPWLDSQSLSTSIPVTTWRDSRLVQL